MIKTLDPLFISQIDLLSQETISRDCPFKDDVSDFSSTHQLLALWLTDSPTPSILGPASWCQHTTFLQTEISVQKITSLLLTMTLILPAILNEHKYFEKSHIFEETNLFSSNKVRPKVKYLNMELCFQSFFGLHVHSCTHWLNPTTPPLPRIWAHIRGRYWSANIDDISL